MRRSEAEADPDYEATRGLVRVAVSREVAGSQYLHIDNQKVLMELIAAERSKKPKHRNVAVIAAWEGMIQSFAEAASMEALEAAKPTRRR